MTCHCPAQARVRGPDPWLAAHYELADEFGKFMHCRAFGVEPGPGDGAACSLPHPNAHMVTTSFWHSFPAVQFWMNSKYPNVDYADVHAYVSTSYAPLADGAWALRDAAFDCAIVAHVAASGENQRSVV